MNRLTANAVSRIEVSVISAAIFALSLAPGCASSGKWDGRLSQYGEMRKVLGEGQNQGRITLAEATSKPHCYAVGALADLRGEITVADGDATVSSVGDDGQLVTARGVQPDQVATMFVAACVPNWTETTADRDVSPDEFEQFVHDAAFKLGLDASAPFPYLIEGELTGLDIHVINGGCPIRAEMLGEPLPEDQQPWRAKCDQATGRLIGIYAEGGAGTLTNHGSNTHVHALLKDNSGALFTAHVEHVGLKAGAVIKLPTP